MVETETKSGRRSFLIQTGTILGIGIAGSMVPALITSCEKTESPVYSSVKKEINLADYPDLDYDYGSVKISYKGLNQNMPVIIIRLSEGNFLALNSICTHQACEVDYPDTTTQTIECPCHKSLFSIADGSVIKGPATIPLRKVPCTFDPATKIITIMI